MAEGKIVISNRYVSANMGHQAGKIHDMKERDVYLEWLDNLEYGIFGIPKPDKNILLYMPTEIGQQLVDKKGDRE
ncbi:TPA: thymidylate kinase, partial [Patescibacteria group bacterium]|nr:thymidylate kinase [Candidatus Gracilibacteria bacterium]